MGLYYLKSRYYDPEICRFINADDPSMLGAGGGFVSYNLFAYCGDNPVNCQDPSGFKIVPVTENWSGGNGEPPEYELINGQGLEPYNTIRYGISSVGFSGCEAIAIYNALILAGKARSFGAVKASMLHSIYRFGGYWTLGLFGGTRSDICNTLNSLHVDYTSANYDELCNAGESTVMIAGFWTTSSLFNGKVTLPSIHTVAFTYSGGKYTAYNYFNDSPKVRFFPSLSELVKGEDSFIYGFIINS